MLIDTTINANWMHTIDYQKQVIIGAFFFYVLYGVRYPEFLQNDRSLLMEHGDLLPHDGGALV